MNPRWKSGVGAGVLVADDHGGPQLVDIEEQV